MTFTTANLCDAHSEEVNFQIAEPLLKPYGGRSSFCGQITTVKAFEGNVLIRTVLEEKVENRVLVVDGGGSHRCALIDADLAVANFYLFFDSCLKVDWLYFAGIATIGSA